MRLLIDTHVFFWSFNNKAKLSRAATAALTDPNNEFFVSVVSIWEMQIKTMLGKMDIGDSLRTIVEEQLQNGISILPISLEHALNLGTLPNSHKDPFDRMIIAQALVEEMTIVTADSKFSQYNAPILW